MSVTPALAWPAGIALAAGYAVYAGLSLLTCVGPIDRWLRTRHLGRRTARAVLPFWGLFAQQFGMFDVDVSFRTVGADHAAGAWRPLTDGRRTWASPLWRPARRPDQIAQILALRILRTPDRDTNAPATVAYRRILRRCRARAAGDPGAAEVEFRVRVSRGFWAAAEPRIVYASRREPVHDR